MFYYLKGTVAILGQNHAVLDCGGVGFSVNTTVNTLSQLQTGKTALLYTHCNIREDAFDIFGFATRQELETFRLLLGVSGVGPKAALSILSATTPEGLATAVVTQNEKALTAAAGVGKKLAQRILLELKDKLASGMELDLSAAAPTPAFGSKAAEAAQALNVLGYDQSEISAAMKGLDTEALEVQEIVKQALKAMMRA